jgi:hypothetical protein
MRMAMTWKLYDEEELYNATVDTLICQKKRSVEKD